MAFGERWPEKPMKMADNVVVEEVEYHRNGISGEGFHVIKFLDPQQEGRFVGVVFPLEEGARWNANGRVAVFNRDLLGQGNIQFGENSWRGDHYEEPLRKAIAKSEGRR